jgi:hypothetical protein
VKSCVKENTVRILANRNHCSAEGISQEPQQILEVYIQYRIATGVGIFEYFKHYPPSLCNCETKSGIVPVKIHKEE